MTKKTEVIFSDSGERFRLLYRELKELSSKLRKWALA